MGRKIYTWSDKRLYLIVAGAMAIVIAIYKPVLGVIFLLMVAYLVYFAFSETRRKNQEIDEYIKGLSDLFESVTKRAIFNMPFPLVLIDDKGTIIWYNTPFLRMIVEEDILNARIYDLVPGFNLDGILKSESPTPISYDSRDYLIFPNYVDSKKLVDTSSKTIILYWVDNTDYVNLEKTYKDEETILALAYVDNYDDVKNNTPDINRPLLLAEIDKNITEYFSRYNGLVRKYENDKYLIILDHKSLEKIQEKRFDILDNIRELDYGNKIPITLSIGVSATGVNFIEAHDNARVAIDIALGRGGDQGVLNKNGAFEFYGGKSKAMEKRNKVRSRVIGYALRQLIDQSDQVFVMGHKNPDMDSLGSAIGILRGIDNRGKSGYIILNEENPSIKNLLDKLKEKQPALLEKIVSTESAEDLISGDSLIIMVDNHKPSFSEAPELLALTKKVVIIDHHRRGAEFVENPVLTYLEPYASSTSELVTEILSYMSDNINLTKFEAEALLAGIMVDTNNFSNQTGVRTFEAASILKREGADTITVKQLFRENHETFIYRAGVIKSSKIIKDKIAIGFLEEELENGVLVAAQSANELLDINGVLASFVLTPNNGKIHISGRSLGEISVQLILESLGGGGHLTSAGAQLSGVTLLKAEEHLINAIDKYFKEGEAK